MKKLVVHSEQDIGFETSDVPKPGEGEVLLQVLQVGICGSDLQVFNGNQPFARYPVIPGHELSARVVEFGVGSTGKFRIGEIVTVIPYFNCSHCRPCKEGRINCCLHNKTMGVARDGALQEYIVIPESRLVSGEGMDPTDLALIEPYSISAHAVAQAKAEERKRWLVIGGGPIGGFASKAARAYAPIKTVITDVNAKRVARLATHQLGVAVDRTVVAMETVIQDHTANEGFDYVIEATGTPAGFLDAIEAVTIGGTVSLVGNGSVPVSFVHSELIKKEITVVGSRNSRDLFESLISESLDSGFKPSDFVTRVVAFDDSDEYFRSGMSQNDYKVVIQVAE